ncbi:hypothetical protein SODALDRAFT_271487, partial [Sodiomyces alkalinus F11]
LPKRSTTNIVATLIYHIKIALNRRKVATLIIIDIKGAFDTVLRNRLYYRLRE